MIKSSSIWGLMRARLARYAGFLGRLWAFSQHSPRYAWSWGLTFLAHREGHPISAEGFTDWLYATSEPVEGDQLNVSIL
jgi:hypothetical protein